MAHLQYLEAQTPGQEDRDLRYARLGSGTKRCCGSMARACDRGCQEKG